ncbi:MAG: ParB N-terminal domain-containing protein [Oscillospiraceae bacterium]
MNIVTKRIADMNRATYNPRIELRPGDDEYEKLRYSLDTFGLVVPIIWNERTNTVVGGHQRLTVLENNGVEEVDVSVVDLDETQEKQLNIALNKVGGNWDEAKLKELLDELGEDASLTGFSQAEIEALQNDIENLVDEGFLNDELSQLENLFNLPLIFSTADRADINAFLKDYGKSELVKVIIQKVKGEI